MFSSMRSAGRRKIELELSWRIISREYRSWQAQDRSQGAFIDIYARARLARLASGRMGTHLSDAAHVEPNRRENPLGAHPAREPLVEYRAICKFARFNDLTNSIPWRRV